MDNEFDIPVHDISTIRDRVVIMARLRIRFKFVVPSIRLNKLPVSAAVHQGAIRSQRARVS